MESQAVPLPPGVAAGLKYRPENTDPFFLMRLLNEVAVKYGIPVAGLRSPRRFAMYFAARSEFCYRAFMESAASLVRIGKVLGGRDHTTVRNAIGQYCVARNIPLPKGVSWEHWMRKKNIQPSTSFVSLGEVAASVVENLERQRADGPQENK